MIEMKTYLLYNSKSNNGAGEQSAKKIREIRKYKNFEKLDLTNLSYPEFFASLGEDDEVVICGGDGTLNHLVNDMDCSKIKNDVYYYPAGTGNDFWRDIGKNENSEPEKINKYIVNLPVVKVKGKTKRFINGIGYGIDGFCCEEGDRLRKKAINRLTTQALQSKVCSISTSLQTPRLKLTEKSTISKNAGLLPQ